MEMGGFEPLISCLQGRRTPVVLHPRKLWSARMDLNHRPLAPKASALPNCATDGQKLEEGVGFEPTDAFTSLVFKTRALNHSANLPLEPMRGFEPRHDDYKSSAPPLELHRQIGDRACSRKNL